MSPGSLARDGARHGGAATAARRVPLCALLVQRRRAACW